MASSLCDLPLELVHHIFSSLDAVSLARCKTTCKLLCSVVDSSIHATYIMELARNGLHGDATFPDISGRLDTLRRWKAGWGKPTAEKRQLDLLDGNSWELYGNVLAMQDESLDRLRFTRLPSPLTSGTSDSEDTWTIPISDIKVLQDFGMDPSQDLLVLLEVVRLTGQQMKNGIRSVLRFHWRTMSTGQAHPVAKEHIVEIKSRGYTFSEVEISLQISGEYAGALIQDDRVDTLVIFNWMTSVVQLLVEDRTSSLLSFAFLNNTHIIVTTTEGFPTIFNFLEADSTVSYPDCYSIGPSVSLAFPIHSEWTSSRIRCDPSYSWPNNTSSVPFFDDPDQVIYTVSLWFGEQNDEPWLVVIPRKTILGVLQQAKVLSSPGYRRSSVPWELWGTTGTRVFHPDFYAKLSEVWTCHTFGSTMVLFDKKKRFASIYDFNQRRVNEEIVRGAPALIQPLHLPRYIGGGASPILVCTEPSIIPSSTMYFDQANLKSLLPFRVRSFALPECVGNTAVMCSQNCIIVVHETEQDGGRFDIVRFEF